MAEQIKTDNLIVHQEKAALYRLGMWLIDHRKASGKVLIFVPWWFGSASRMAKDPA